MGLRRGKEREEEGWPTKQKQRTSVIMARCFSRFVASPWCTQLFLQWIKSFGTKGQKDVHKRKHTGDTGLPVFLDKLNAFITSPTPKSKEEQKQPTSVKITVTFLRLPLLSIFNSYLPITIPVQFFSRLPYTSFFFSWSNLRVPR